MGLYVTFGKRSTNCYITICYILQRLGAGRTHPLFSVAQDRCRGLTHFSPCCPCRASGGAEREWPAACHATPRTAGAGVLPGNPFAFGLLLPSTQLRHDTERNRGDTAMSAPTLLRHLTPSGETRGELWGRRACRGRCYRPAAAGCSPRRSSIISWTASGSPAMKRLLVGGYGAMRTPGGASSESVAATSSARA